MKYAWTHELQLSGPTVHSLHCGIISNQSTLILKIKSLRVGRLVSMINRSFLSLACRVGRIVTVRILPSIKRFISNLLLSFETP